MFEQSSLASPNGKRPWMFGLAIAAEVLVVAVIVAIPLFSIPRLAPPKLFRVIRYPNAVKLVPAHFVRSAASNVPRPVREFRLSTPLIAPRRVPNYIANINELAPAIASIGAAVPGDLGAGGIAPGGVPVFERPLPPPPARPAVSTGPIRVSSRVQEAKLINKVIPRYPPLAVQTRQFGTVRLLATVGKDGRVKEIDVLSGPSFLVPAAVEAVRQWVYQPTLLNGRPVEVVASVDINFVLNR